MIDTRITMTTNSWKATRIFGDNVCAYCIDDSLYNNRYIIIKEEDDSYYADVYICSELNLDHEVLIGTCYALKYREVINNGELLEIDSLFLS